MNLIDTYLHVGWEHADEIARYLAPTWHRRWFHGAGHTAPGLKILPKYYDPDRPCSRSTATPQVSRPANLEAEWLLPHGIDAVIASVYDAPMLSTYGDVDYPSAVATAINRWLEEVFLSANPRCYGSIAIATQDPVAAAQEIRRAARNPQMVQVVLPMGCRLPYGHRFYSPIYEAAAENGLAIVIASGTEGIGTSHPPTPHGWPGTQAEMSIAPATHALCHLTSLITEGVFTRWPELKFVMAGTGIAWLPTYLWRFDKNFKALRSEAPWVRELPSEMVCRHFRFISQGVGPAEPPEAFWRLLKSLPAGQQLLMYGSHYPRFAAEPPCAAFALQTAFAPDWRTAIAAGNALTTYPRMAASLTSAAAGSFAPRPPGLHAE